MSASSKPVANGNKENIPPIINSKEGKDITLTLSDTFKNSLKFFASPVAQGKSQNFQYPTDPETGAILRKPCYEITPIKDDDQTNTSTKVRVKDNGMVKDLSSIDEVISGLSNTSVQDDKIVDENAVYTITSSQVSHYTPMKDTEAGENSDTKRSSTTNFNKNRKSKEGSLRNFR